jgi:hypothetical protein
MAVSRFSTSRVGAGLPKYQKFWDGTTTTFDSNFELIERINVTSTTASVAFSSIPSTYRDLQVRYIARDTGTSTVNNLAAYFNTDTTYTNYYWHILEGTGTTAAADSVQVSAFPTSFGLEPGTATGSNIFGVGIVNILDYTNTNKTKVFNTIGGMENNGGTNPYFRYGSGMWNSTAAITSITLYPQPTGSLAQYSSFALYGIKGAA